MSHRIELLAAVAVVAACVASAPAASAAPYRGVDRDALVYQGSSPDRDGLNAIFVSDADGTHPRRLFPDVSGDLLHPDWSPDGRSVVAVQDDQEGTSRIVRSSLDGRSVTTIVTCTGECDYIDFPAYSPDGRSIAYTSYIPNPVPGPPIGSRIIVRDLRSGTERVVASSSDSKVLDTARWSGNGRSLVVGIDRFDSDGFETGSSIATIDLGSGRLRRLMPFDSYAYAPDWNHRTGEIVFSNETLQFTAEPPTRPRDLFVVRPDGSGLRRITHVRGNRMVWQPAWEPDGSGLVATLDEPGDRVGVRVDDRSGRITRLVPGTVMTHLKQRPAPGGS